MKYKVSFNKFSVLLMYVNVIGFIPICLILKEYPPTSFIIAWFVFWGVQAIVTCRLEIHKRNKKEKTELLEAVTPYINEENASALIEKYIGIDPVYKKGAKK